MACKGCPLDSMAMRCRAFKGRGVRFNPCPPHPMGIAGAAFKAAADAPHPLLCGFASAADEGYAMSDANYTRFVGLYVTPEMDDYLKLLAGRQKSTVSEVVRQAIRDHLDMQEQLMGSRSRLGNRIARQLAQMQDRFQEQQLHADTLLLAAIILTEMRQGKEGSKVLRDIAALAAHAAPEIRAVLAASAETDRRPPSGS